MRVYGMKDESLWDTKEFKMRVYGMKDESLWDTKEFKMRVYGMPLITCSGDYGKHAFSFLKVFVKMRVYGMKVDNLCWHSLIFVV